MAIDYSQLRSLTAREIITALIRDGFFLRPRLAATKDTVTPMAGA
jgi:hypothetical protein